MGISPLQHPPVNLDPAALERLRTSKTAPESEKVAAACRGFEAVLLRQILSEVQRPAFPSKFTSNSTTTGIYRDLVVNQLAESISQSGSFGLAQTLSRELSRQLTGHRGGPSHDLKARKINEEHSHL
jgi:Rod binding domain-containing protein